jgi:hypothetical protein
MSQKDRAQTVRTFSNDASVRIMLISLKYVTHQLCDPPDHSYMFKCSPFRVLSSAILTYSILSYPTLPCSTLLYPVLPDLALLLTFPLTLLLTILLTLLNSPRAGGVGLNLTSASVVILLDPWWNPSTEDQAIDRYTRHMHTYSHTSMHTRTPMYTHAFTLICSETHTHLHIHTNTHTHTRTHTHTHTHLH